MGPVGKRVILLIGLSLALLGPVTARAASYQQALDAYSEQNYSRSYKKAMSLAREKKGVRRGKALMLAAAAVLELDREEKARALFKKALHEDPDLELPEVVRSRRAQRFFADVRDGRESPRAAVVRSERTETAFDRVETYLPLGLNQFAQGKLLLGLVFGGAQGLGLYLAYTKNREASETEAATAALRQRAIQTGDDINPVYLNLLAENKASIKRATTLSQLSIGLTTLAYGLSVLEAGFRAPASVELSLLHPRLEGQGLRLTYRF